MSDKSLPASGRKIDKAKRKGQVARSPELVSEAVLMWGLFLLSMTLGTSRILLAWFRALLKDCLGLASVGAPTGGQLVKLLVTGVGPGLGLLGFLFLGSLTLAVLLNQAVSGGAPLSLEALQLHFDRVNPLAGLKRIFMPNTWGMAGLALLKLAFALGVLAMVLPQNMEAVAVAGATAPGQVYELVAGKVQSLGFALAGALLAMAALQAVWSRKRWVDELKMDRQEAVEDSKEADGNPLTKRRYRMAHRRLARRRTQAAVATADVVLANPTHVAVALRYKRGQMRAPRVVAKGADLMAQRIKDIARELGVPVIEQPPLARELYASVEVGREIPLKLYRAVARVIGQIQQWRSPQFAAPRPGRTV